MPKGFLTEVGPSATFTELLGAVELPTAGYPARTERNVRDSDATIWFGTMDSPGAEATLEACWEFCKSSLRVEDGVTLPSHVVAWLGNHNVGILNGAGKAPELGDRVKRFLGHLFHQLRFRPVG